MFDFAIPWWQFVLRAAAVYVVLMVLIRASGKRSVGEFTPFDMVVVILLAESVQGSLNAGDESLGGGLLIATTLVALNWLVGFVSARSPAFDRLTEGEPVVLLRDGRALMRALRRNNIPETDLDEAIRRAGLPDRSRVAWAVLETDGKITVIALDA